MNNRGALPLIAILLVISSSQPLFAKPNLPATLMSGTAILTGVDRAGSLIAQITSWPEPVLMLVLGLALLIVAISIRLWAKKRIKNAANRAFPGVEKTGEDLSLFSHGKVAVKKEERWPS